MCVCVLEDNRLGGGDGGVSSIDILRLRGKWSKWWWGCRLSGGDGGGDGDVCLEIIF